MSTRSHRTEPGGRQSANAPRLLVLAGIGLAAAASTTVAVTSTATAAPGPDGTTRHTERTAATQTVRREVVGRKTASGGLVTYVQVGRDFGVWIPADQSGQWELRVPGLSPQKADCAAFPYFHGPSTVSVSPSRSAVSTADVPNWADSTGCRNTSIWRWSAMSRLKDPTVDKPQGGRRQWAADRALRAPMRSPGRPEPSRAVQREFWRLIATGITTVEASAAVGVSWPVGARWFRHAGGMPPLILAEPSGRYLLFAEREEIALLRTQGKGVREIARVIGRDPGTVSRELRRNAATRGGKREYRALVAQWKAQQAAKRPKTAKLVDNERLREYVQDRLAGNVHRLDGTVVPGPKTPPWKGLNKPHRQDRRWSTAWSPEQISHRLRLDFPDDESMRISHEAIYQSLFIEGRGALKRELVACLRTGRALREPRARSRNKPQGHVSADVVLSERPAEAADRAVPGHWEGDLIIGTDKSAIGTLVERSSRSTLLVHLPRLEGWGETPRVKNGPALGGYGAVAMNTALTASITTLPQQLRKTLTWDRGKELSAHAQFALGTGTRVFFADPHSPWQRPTNENTNGLLRQYFPKGTDLSRWPAEDLEAVAHALNNRPRKTLGWKTPAEVFEEQLRSLQQAGVASTG